jgi:hypothetical protein
MFLRASVLPILRGVVPSDYGDARFERLTGGDYTQGYGTTCGYLTSYLLWALGCRAPEIVNRTDPKWGLRYEAGANISRLVGGAKALGAWHDGPAGIRMGDCYFLSNEVGDPSSEHVGVFLYASGIHWYTVDAGQRNEAGNQAARFSTRTFDGRHLSGPGGGGARLVRGYVDIDALPYAAARSGFGFALLLLAGAAAAATLLGDEDA